MFQLNRNKILQIKYKTHLSSFRLSTWIGGVLQVTQARLLCDPIDELGRFAVLVAGRQIQRGQLLCRVFIQDHALVHHHRRRETVLWRGREERRGFISTILVAFVMCVGTI